ncbi:hypothetical protein [Parendozoicomonas sp. Alg238-R29]|uniref:hypothetical protein n=1 Tax=Parendozoicomonas sp. Alg238-R29 TaxID=2993446 RepID=UPI00248E372C|nr:hypothetical protein [Parendozoicomonas sp. Alg238-R29]
MLWKKALATSLLALGCQVSLAAPLLPVEQTDEAVQSTQTCFNFEESNWLFSRNKPAIDWPKIKGGVLSLLPDNLFSGAVAAILRSPIRPPFEATFEFRTFDEDGGPQHVWNSADGISFFFYKDGSRYGTPPNGNFMGFSASGGGYAVQMPTYGQRRIRFREASGLTFQTNPFRQSYTHGAWVPLKIHVLPNRVLAWSGDRKLIDVALNFNTEFSDLGFSAATGAADSEHQVKNFCLSPIQSQVVDKKKSERKEEKDVELKPESPVVASVVAPVEQAVKKLEEQQIVPPSPVNEETVEQTPVVQPEVTPEPEVYLPKGPIEPYDSSNSESNSESVREGRESTSVDVNTDDEPVQETDLPSDVTPSENLSPATEQEESGQEWQEDEEETLLPEGESEQTEFLDDTTAIEQ